MLHASSTLTLSFETDEGEEPLRGQLSAVVQADGHLWIASDESNSVERLSRVDGTEYGRHRRGWTATAATSGSPARTG